MTGQVRLDVQADVNDAARSALRQHHAVTLFGPPGSGKTTLVNRLVAAERAGGSRVLLVRPMSADSGLCHSGLAELLISVDPSATTSRAEPRWEVLQAVLRRSPIPPGGWDSLAVRLGLAELLDRLAQESSLLIVVDDAHWLDPASHDALRGALKITRATGIRTITTERMTPTATLRAGTPRVWLPPLGLEQMATLVTASGLPYRWVGHVQAVSGGNPAIGLATAHAVLQGGFAHRAPEPVRLPAEVRAVVREWLADVDEPVRSTLLMAGIARYPTVTLLGRAAPGQAQDALLAASDAGLVTVLGDRVRFTARATATVLAAEAGLQDRRLAHAVLAHAVDDPAEVVWHRAQAAAEISMPLASELSSTAADCRQRGDYAFAAELGLLAVARMPPGQEQRGLAWLVAAAEDAALAGRANLARHAAAQVLARSDRAADRVGAQLALIDSAGQELSGTEELFARATVEAAGYPELQAAVHQRAALKAHLCDGDLRWAAAEAGRAAQLSSVPERRSAALALKARMQRGLGDPAAQGTLAAAVSSGSSRMARFVAARHALFDDQLQAARVELLSLLPVVELSGATEELGEVLRCLVETEARAGRCADCLVHADRMTQIRAEAGMAPGVSWYVQAVAELAGGSFTRAEHLANLAVASAEEDHDVVFLPSSLAVVGQLKLVLGEAKHAVPILRRVRRIEAAQGMADPSIVRWHGDLAEALVRTGEITEAAELIEQTRSVARHQGRPGVLAAMDRAEAVMLVARGDPGLAVPVLETAAARFRELGLPIDHGRTLLTLGRLLLTRRRRIAAGKAVQRAVSTFDDVGARPWVRLATSELKRLDVRGPQQSPTGRLSPAEAELAELVAAGLSNREAAIRLFISVKTVEGRLTRIYRTVGVRSRSQLVGLLRRDRISRGNGPVT